ncbi:MAG TPA: PIG-L family deacetylase [Actinomycetes bacterium]|nr:PIG-L family deacetylase [Actinomycetes bacterium]
MPAARVVTRPGLSSATWDPTLARADPLRLPTRLDGEHAVVVAAHPDDEVLGAAGLIQVLRRRGAQIKVVICTDGSAALPGLGAGRRRELAAVRRMESRRAMTVLGLPETALRFLDLPDGELAAHETALPGILAQTVRNCSFWVAPWRHDPHPDHAAAGRAAARAAAPGSELLEYPIWMRHSMLPRHPVVRAGSLRVLTLDRRRRAHKQVAIRAHTSQLATWDAGYEPVLPQPVVALFQGSREPFFQAAR